MVLAAGAEYPTEYGIWGIDLRYSQGFVDVHKSDDVKNRNQSIGFALTYKFDVVDLFFRLTKKDKNASENEVVEGKSKAKGLKVEE